MILTQRQLISKVTNNQSGFTLMEVMIVLSIMLLICPLFYQNVMRLQEHQSIKSFEQKVETELYLAQLTAIAEEKIISVRFDTENHVVRVYSDVFHEVDRLYFPRDVTVKPLTHILTFQFNYNGSVDKAGSIVIESPHYSFQITFLLGQGRFYVQAI